MIKNYFEDENVFYELNMKVKKDLNGIHDDIADVRLYYETVNYVLQFINQMDRFHFKISLPVIDISTRKFSKFYISELSHTNIDEYNNLFKYLYNIITDEIQKFSVESVYDFGGGIPHIYRFLMNQNMEYLDYTILDKNSNLTRIIDFNNYNNLKFINVDLIQFDYSTLNPQLILICNTLKHLDSETLLKIAESINLNDNISSVVIQDIETVLSEFLKLIKHEEFEIMKHKQNIVVIRRIK